MRLYTLARKVNKKFKEKQKERAGRFLSPVRRFERFSVNEDEKLVSMTFDDGPMNMPINPVLILNIKTGVLLVFYPIL